MKVYIAGKISGDERYKEKFKKVQEEIEDAGDVALNPAIQPEGMSGADYMRICFAMMDSADVVLFLPDYGQSRGAMLEHTWCQYVGKQTMYYDTEKRY